MELTPEELDCIGRLVMKEYLICESVIKKMVANQSKAKEDKHETNTPDTGAVPPIVKS